MSNIRTSGKWILCGEHAVLRGSPAIAFPLHSQFFEIEYKPGDTFSLQSKSGRPLLHLEPFRKALEYGLSLLKKNSGHLKGSIIADANITLGAGLGGSATLCVTIGKLFHTLNWISQDQLFSFCRELEDVFHGKSSGLDVAVILADQGIHFEMSGDYHLLKCSWKPNWYLSYSGVSSRTSDDVGIVKNYISQNVDNGKQTDALMIDSVLMAEKALAMDEKAGLHLLTKSIEQAATCFARWNLQPLPMRQQIEKIKTAGALAVKPTGSGGGGYILSLWPAGITPKDSDLVFYPA